MSFFQWKSSLFLLVLLWVGVATACSHAVSFVRLEDIEYVCFDVIHIGIPQDSETLPYLRGTPGYGRMAELIDMSNATLYVAASPKSGFPSVGSAGWILVSQDGRRLAKASQLSGSSFGRGEFLAAERVDAKKVCAPKEQVKVPN